MRWGVDAHQEGFNMASSLLVLLAFLVSSAWSQQLQGASMSMTYSGLSTSCQQALNTSVSCPLALSPLSQNGAILDEEGTVALCVDSCYSSLESARSTIAGACTASTDVIVENEVAYPATFFVDNYIYTYDVSCRKDSATGQFCDPQLLAWSSQKYFTANQSCSDCWLGVLALQLSNPLGYDPGLASNFASLMSGCNATAYGFTSPTAYALNLTSTTVSATVTAVPPPACTGLYTVGAADDCISVSKNFNVSTYSLLYYNNLDIYCQNFAAAVGTNLCIPPQCTTYTWQALDTCNNLVSNFTGMTVPQFLAWNPNFNSLCQNAAAFTGYQVCIGPPGGLLNYTTSTNLSVTTAATIAMPAPTNAMNGLNRNCGDWYTIIEGDMCGLVSVANYISLSDFYFLNPEINGNCTNLDLGIAYCVEPVGDIHTYPGYTVSGGPTITVPPATFSSVNTAIPTSTGDPGFLYTSSLLQTASGTIHGCDIYQNYDNSTGFRSNCSYIAFAYQVTTDELLKWNLSLLLNLSTCNLQSGYSYCVEQTNTMTLTSPSYCISVNATTIESGTTSTCNCFMVVHGYDNGSYGCWDIESDYSVTADQLATWNTWLSLNCDMNLYANLNSSDTRPVCVGVNVSVLVGTATTPPTTTPPQTRTTTAAFIGPTPTGIVAGCQHFYMVQSGDTCYNIETTYGITFGQFYQWNPSVGSNCENLWLGYSYCVKGPASTTGSGSPTTTSTGGSSAPTQSGIASKCNKYYTVTSGDSCSKIETQFNDTFVELYQWNPAIGDTCQSLWVGYAICVGVSS